jgi:hypothetical protein
MCSGLYRCAVRWNSTDIRRKVCHYLQGRNVSQARIRRKGFSLVHDSRWRWYIASKCRWTSARAHGVTPQNIVIFACYWQALGATAVRWSLPVDWDRRFDTMGRQFVPYDIFYYIEIFCIIFSPLFLVSIQELLGFQLRRVSQETTFASKEISVAILPINCSTFWNCSQLNFSVYLCHNSPS